MKIEEKESCTNDKNPKKVSKNESAKVKKSKNAQISPKIRVYVA